MEYEVWRGYRIIHGIIFSLVSMAKLKTGRIMTVRDHLNGRIRSAKKWFLAGIFMFFSSIIPTITLRPSGTLSWLIPIFAIVAWLVAAVGYIRLWFLKCPCCGGRLWFLAMAPSGNYFRLNMSKDYKYCLYCGKSFDAEIRG